MSWVISFFVRDKEGASSDIETEVAFLYQSHEIETRMSTVHTSSVSPCEASWRDDSRAKRVYLHQGNFHILCMKEIDMVHASIINGGATSCARMISCGTDALALIIREIIAIKGLSIHLHCSVLPERLWPSNDGPHSCTS